MTENEAIERAIRCIVGACDETCSGYSTYIKNGCCSGYEEVAEGLSKALEEIQQYRAIGTIDEFKDLKEKNTPKKPIYSDFDENEDGKIIPYKAACPACGHEFEFGTWNDEENHHCVCDQKLDWEGGE